MRLLHSVVLLLLLQTSAALACSCSSTGTACTWLKSTEAVFVGRVTKDSGEGIGNGPATLVVEEVLHGVPKEWREVTVDTSAGTSCYMRLKLNERYVIYGSHVAGAERQVRVGACSFSFPLTGDESLLSALREAEKGKTARLVGRIQENGETYDSGGRGADGVKVIATAPGVRLETSTKSNGDFEFFNVEPGKYHLATASPQYFEDEWRWPREDPTVRASSCEYQNLYVWPNGQIEGVVRTKDGKPLAGVPVQAFTKDRRGNWDSSPVREQKTGENGAYLLSGLPPGEVIIAVNGETYNDRVPWAPTFYPGVAERSKALILNIGRAQKRTGIDLELAPARKPARLHIELVLEDGSPAVDGSAKVQNLAGVQRAFVLGTDTHSNLLEVAVYAGETYIVTGILNSVTLMEPVAKGVPIRAQSTTFSGLAGPIQVTGPEARVRVILRKELK